MLFFLSQSIATNMDRIRVHRLFRTMTDDYLIVVPDTHSKSWVHNDTGIPMRNIVVSGIPVRGIYNLTRVRQWMWDNLLPDGAKYVIANDNIERLVQVDPVFYGDKKIEFDDYDFDRADWVDIFGQPCKDVAAVIQELFAKMTEEETILAGVGGVANFFFRKYKWSFRSLVRGDFFVGVKSPLQLPGPECPTWDDWYRSLAVMSHYSKVVVNRWVMPVKPENEAGGLGPEDSRTEAKRIAAKFLAERFPHMVEVHKKRSDALTLRRGRW